jgi:hypothetical protein
MDTLDRLSYLYSALLLICPDNPLVFVRQNKKPKPADRSQLCILFQSYTDSDSIALLTVSKPVLTRIPTLAMDG